MSPSSHLASSDGDIVYTTEQRSEALGSFQRRLGVSYLDRVIHLPQALYAVVQPLKRVMARPEQTKLEWRRGFPGFQSSLEVLSRENAARLALGRTFYGKHLTDVVQRAQPTNCVGERCSCGAWRISQPLVESEHG